MNLYLAILSLWGYPLHNALVGEFPTILDRFLRTPQALRGGVVRSHEVVDYSEANNFLGKMIYIEAPLYSVCQLYGDFQQGGCLYKPSSGIKWTHEHL